VKMNKQEAQEILKDLDFEKDLIVAVARDSEDKEILMVAFMNEEAVLRTLTTGLMHYWSRSRNEIWQKGEESGNRQKIQEVYLDCDGDTLLFDVKAEGPACHKGYQSCFYRKIENGKVTKIMEKEFDPEEVYD